MVEQQLLSWLLRKSYFMDEASANRKRHTYDLVESDFLKMSQMKKKLKKDFTFVLENWEERFGNQVGWMMRKLYRSFINFSDLISEKTAELYATGVAAIYRIFLSKAYDEKASMVY